MGNDTYRLGFYTSWWRRCNVFYVNAVWAKTISAPMWSELVLLQRVTKVTSRRFTWTIDTFKSVVQFNIVIIQLSTVCCNPFLIPFIPDEPISTSISCKFTKTVKLRKQTKHGCYFRQSVWNTADVVQLLTLSRKPETTHMFLKSGGQNAPAV